MCEPATILMMATATQAIGSVVSGVAQSNQLKRSAAIDEANAQTAIQNSINLRNAGAVNAGRQNRIGRRAGSKIRTAGAKGNVVVDLDNNLDAQIDNAANSMLNELDEVYKAKINAQRQEVQSRNFKSSASNKRASASSSLLGGLFGAGKAVTAGAYKGYDAGYFGQPLLKAGET